MAGEMLYSGLGDLRTTEALATSEYLLLLADRNWLGNHPALWKYPRPLNASGTTTIKIAHAGLDGYNAMVAPTNEDDSQANVALTDASSTVAIARQSFAREASGLAAITDSLGMINPARFAQDALGAYNARLTNLLTALMGGFSTSVGTSGVNMALSDFLAAKAALVAANANGSMLAILHSVQLSDLISELATTTGGAVQFMQATADLIQSRGEAYQGNLLGVDIMQSNRIPTANAGADRAGGMFTRGAVVWADATPQMDDPTQQMLIGNQILFERDRTARNDRTAWVSHAYLGVAEAIDARGVAIITDA